jgi:hypothetical protein
VLVEQEVRSGCRRYVGHLHKLLAGAMPNGVTIPILTKSTPSPAARPG